MNKNWPGSFGIVTKHATTTEEHLEPTTEQLRYRSGPVNSKSFVGKVFVWIKWKFELQIIF